MNTEPIFSIIIPHYNIPKLLRRCLDSIPQRDDLEIIVVDDCSNPEIVDFDHFPGKERSDVRIIFSKQNGGGGYARNLGLDVAKGKWILFADADDNFTYYLNEMLDKYKDSDADIVYFNVAGSHTEYYTLANRGGHLNNYIKQASSNRKLAEFNLKYLFGEPWCKLAKRDIIVKNHIRFDHTPIHNDTTYSYLVGHYSKKVKIDPHAIYILTVREMSVSRDISEAKRFVRIEVFARRDKFLRETLGIVDDTMAFHYKEIYEMVFNGEWTLAKKGVDIIHQYVPSYSSIWYHVLKRIPGNLKASLKRHIRSFFVALHLMSRREEDYHIKLMLTSVKKKGGGKQNIVISMQRSPLIIKERRVRA